MEVGLYTSKQKNVDWRYSTISIRCRTVHWWNWLNLLDTYDPTHCVKQVKSVFNGLSPQLLNFVLSLWTQDIRNAFNFVDHPSSRYPTFFAYTPYRLSLSHTSSLTNSNHQLSKNHPKPVQHSATSLYIFLHFLRLFLSYYLCLCFSHLSFLCPVSFSKVGMCVGIEYQAELVEAMYEEFVDCRCPILY